MSGGGFSPRLKRTSLGVDGEIAFLASEHYQVKRAGATLAGSGAGIPAVNEDGDRVIKAGTLVTPRASDGKYVVHTGISDEVQTVTVTGSPTGGTFTLTYSGQTTAPIAYNADPEEVEDALVALSNIGEGDVAVTGNDGGPFTVTFGGALADTNVAQMTASGSGLTGGSTPGVTVATAAGGGDAGTPTLDPDVSGYVLESYNVKDGDVVGGILIHGSVLKARVTPAPDATIRAALKGRITFQ